MIGKHVTLNNILFGRWEHDSHERQCGSQAKEAQKPQAGNDQGSVHALMLNTVNIKKYAKRN